MYNINFDLIEFSKVLVGQEVKWGHHIPAQNKIIRNNFDLNLVKEVFVPSIAFFLEYLSLFIFSWLTIFFVYNLIKNHKKFKSFKHFLIDALELKNKLDKKDKKLKFSLKLLLIFNVIFVFLVKNFLAGNIKTSKGEMHFQRCICKIHAKYFLLSIIMEIYFIAKSRR